jgi:hypothetical protein
MVTSEARLESMLDNIAHLARHLVGDEPPGLSQAVVSWEMGDLEKALGLVRVLDQDADVPDPDVKRLEAEILYTGGQFEEAAEAFASAQAAAPEDDEAEAWHQQATAMAGSSPPDPDPDPAPAPSAPAASGNGVTVEEVCTVLFSPEVSSLEVAKLFERDFQDKPVSWSGELERVDAARFDMVFGNTRFTKATLNLKELDGGFASRVIRAVIQLPVDAETALQELAGQRVRFSGTLVRCDAFMRNLFVADATIV